MRTFVQSRRTYGNKGELNQTVARVEKRLIEIEKQNKSQSQTIINAVQELKTSMTELIGTFPKPGIRLSPSALLPGQLEIQPKEANKELRTSGLVKDQQTQIDRIYIVERFFWRND